MRLLLYTRPDCELCDAVAAIARSLGAEIEPVDITEDIGLLERYGTRIPVLRDPDSGRELDFPIDHAKLAAWLDEPS
ncbi:MAG: glutaredoxin family protein [Pseudomonadota bacterium]